jgi:flagellar biosynthesis protein FlhA
MPNAQSAVRPAPAGWLQTARATGGDLAIPLAVLAIITALITPLPSVVLDLLIVLDIMMSIIVLMAAVYITRPVEFSVFPTTLLLLTLFRLALNISSSRLILLHGNAGTAAAGHVIEAFGSFVVGGNYIVGTVIFLVLIAIQYVVINHGAVRISEVTARFTLDALPGKQMSIDSDLNAGLIDETEARRRRKQLSAEAEFYGAMDGASRFTQRDAIASVLITAINIVAGFLIGVFQHGMDLRRALETYTVLTIGDGLVTVIPALMISISGGLIVTRTGSDNRMGADFRRQVFGGSQPLLLASGVLLVLAALPGLPKLPFLAVGGAVGLFAWRMRPAAAPDGQPAAAPKAPPKENLEELLRVEPISIEVGLGLVRLAEGGPNSPLLRRVAGVRRQLADNLGYILPAVRVGDNLSLGSRQYAVLVKGVEVARHELPQGCDLAIPGPSSPKIEGQLTREPAFGAQAWWIPTPQAEDAKRAGYTVVDGISVMGTHFGELARRHAHEIFSRQEAKKFLDRLSADHPKAVEDLVPKLLPLAVVQKVLQNLLREQVSIRDAASIVEALGEAAVSTKNPVLLTEYVRQGLRRSLVKPYLTRSGELPAYLVDPRVEQTIEAAVEHGEHGSQAALAPQICRDILDRVLRAAGSAEGHVVVITTAGARHFLRQLTETALPHCVVLSHGEIPPGVKVLSLGVIQ